MSGVLAVCATVPATAQVRAAAEGAALAGRCARWLPATAVAGAAQRAGVRLVPYQPRTGAGAECNYAAGDTVLLALDVERHAWAAVRFDRLRAGPDAREHQTPVADLGDEAFTYGAFGEYLVVRRGDTVIRLTSWSAMDPRAVRAVGPLLTRDQLIALARHVLGTP